MSNCKCGAVDQVAYILLIVGGLNWGLALLDINLVTMLLGSIPVLVKVVYGLVGASALYMGAQWIMKMIK